MLNLGSRPLKVQFNVVAIHMIHMCIYQHIHIRSFCNLGMVRNKLLIRGKSASGWGIAFKLSMVRVASVEKDTSRVTRFTGQILTLFDLRNPLHLQVRGGVYGMNRRLKMWAGRRFTRVIPLIDFIASQYSYVVKLHMQLAQAQICSTHLHVFHMFYMYLPLGCHSVLLVSRTACCPQPSRHFFAPRSGWVADEGPVKVEPMTADLKA